VIFQPDGDWMRSEVGFGSSDVDAGGDRFCKDCRLKQLGEKSRERSQLFVNDLRCAEGLAKHGGSDFGNFFSLRFGASLGDHGGRSSDANYALLALRPGYAESALRHRHLDGLS
jgi:hypothetical protein